VQKKKKQKQKTAPRVNRALVAIREACERNYAQTDGRVIGRQLGLKIHEQAACEDHLAGLQASIAEVRSKKAKVEAEIAGLTAVLEKRK